MLRDRVDVDSVLDEPAFLLASLLLSYVIDDLVTGERSRLEARRVAEFLTEHRRMPEEGEMDEDDEDQAPDPATWGLLPEHQRGLMAAVGTTGGSLDVPAMSSAASDPFSALEAPLRE